MHEKSNSILKRCEWPTFGGNEVDYHDKEWGVPVHDDRLLFEFLILEGAQAGLSWATILAKRENFRKAFDKFNPEKIATYSQKKIESLLNNPGIIRNKLKIDAAVNNARLFLEVQNEYGSFDFYIWQFVNYKPIQNQFKLHKDIPAQTEISVQMSNALKKRGFKFVGPTICYAFMQAVGMVNDHIIDCFRYKEIKKLGQRS